MRVVIIAICALLLACGEKQNETSSPNKEDSVVKKETEKKIEGVANDSELGLEKLELINEKIRESIDNPDLYLERSKIYADLKDDQSALSDLDRAYRIDTTYLPTMLAQADFLMKRGRVDVSFTILDKAEVLYPKSAEVFAKRGEVFLIARNLTEAISNADLAIKNDPYFAQAYYVKGYAFLELGDTTRAISSYQTTIEQDPDHFDAYLELGIIFSFRNDPLALDYFKNALQINPNERRALYSKGMFEQEHELYNEAIVTYTKAIEAHPNFKEAHHNLGYVHMYYLHLYREATHYFTRAIEVDPKYFEAIYNRGYCFELMGDIGNAEKDYKLALSINPSYDLAAKGLSRLKVGP